MLITSGLPNGTAVAVFALKLNVTSFDSFGPTVTVCVCVPYFSCHASSVYVPGGRLPILNAPSSPLTAKYGCDNTPRNACIQPCTLHSTGIMTSSWSNVFVV